MNKKVPLHHSILKFFIRSFCSIAKKNKDVKKYIFESVLKSELAEYFENGYFQGYRHIEKGIEIARKFSPGGSYAVVDVGGANGKTASIFHNSLPGQKVYVFEPIKSNFATISGLVTDFPRLIPVNKALGNESGSTRINIASRISSSSILELKSDKNSSVFSEILDKVNDEEIIISRLDSEIPSDLEISILKIDVQGYELEVLKGAELCLKRTSIVILELSNHGGYVGSPKYFEIDQKLRDSGFILFDLLPSTMDNGRLVEWDTIYVNKKLLNN
jgi:FkbM family methyltransferase